MPVWKDHHPYPYEYDQIISDCCNTNETDFDKLQAEIIENFKACDISGANVKELWLTLLRESKGRKLIMTRPRFRDEFNRKFKSRLFSNNFLKEIIYININKNEYKLVFNDGIDRTEDVKKLVEKCLKIFVQKQKDLI